MKHFFQFERHSCTRNFYSINFQPLTWFFQFRANLISHKKKILVFTRNDIIHQWKFPPYSLEFRSRLRWFPRVPRPTPASTRDSFREEAPRSSSSHRYVWTFSDRKAVDCRDFPTCTSDKTGVAAGILDNWTRNLLNTWERVRRNYLFFYVLISTGRSNLRTNLVPVYVY